MEVMASDVEFLSPKGDNKDVDPQSGYEKVDIEVPY